MIGRLRELLQRALATVGSRSRDRDLDDELASHLEAATADYVRQGLAQDDARRRARIDLGGVTITREQHREARGLPWVAALALNMRYAVRTLFRSPAVTAIAVLSLALGIGVNTAIFSLFNQLLLRPLPVPAPHELVNLAAPGPKPGSQSCNDAGDCDAVLSYPMFRDLEETGVLAGLAGHRAFPVNLSYRGQTQNGEGMYVSGGYFSTLGLVPSIGRLLGRGDDETVGESSVAVLAHDYWVTRFGSAADVLNTTMVVNGHVLTIVGVAPAGFTGTTLGIQPVVYVPIALRGVLDNFRGFDNRRDYWMYVFGRLGPGATIDSARAALDRHYRSIVNDVEAPLQTGMSEATMEQFRRKPLMVEPGSRGQSAMRGEATGAALTMLFVVTGVVLVITCANIANLLLARSAARTGEMAVRLSIGASRPQLVGQLLLEACLLALLGGIGGLLVAHATMALVVRMQPADVPAVIAFELDWLVLAFTAVLSLGTGMIFGLFPAIQGTRPDLTAALKGTAGQPSAGRAASRFRTALIVGQMALSTALLASAGLFTKSLFNISHVDLGIDVEHLVTFRVSPRLNGYSPEQSMALFERIEESLAALPGVNGVTASMVPILAGSASGTDVRVQGFASGPDVDDNSRLNVVGAGYFRALGIPLIAGRELVMSDRVGAPLVAVVNETFAEKFGLGREAVGKLMGRNGSNGELDIEIVGLVQDAAYNSVKGDATPLFFTPYRQNAQIGALSFYVRTAIEPEQLLRAIPGVVASLDPDLPIEALRTMPQQVRENVFLDRFVSVLSAAFAVLATVLAAVGLYGVLAYTVTQRTREFGLRMALGADGASVRALVLRRVARMVLIGGVVGLTLAWGIGKAAESQLFEVNGSDPLVFAAAFTVLGLVALGAGLAPALRASRIDPMRALRWE